MLYSSTILLLSGAALCFFIAVQESRNGNFRWTGAYFTFVACLSIAGLLIVRFSTVERDDTDPPGGRSGMSLYTDAKTGCQYLGKSDTLTPRLDASGKPICGVAK